MTTEAHYFDRRSLEGGNAFIENNTRMALRKQRNPEQENKESFWVTPHQSCPQLETCHFGSSLTWSWSHTGSENAPKLLSLSLFPGSEEEADLDVVEGTPASSRTSRAGRVTGLLCGIGPHFQTPVKSTTPVEYRHPQAVLLCQWLIVVTSSLQHKGPAFLQPPPTSF